MDGEPPVRLRQEPTLEGIPYPRRMFGIVARVLYEIPPTSWPEQR